jgi:hypothetical protein
MLEFELKPSGAAGNFAQADNSRHKTIDDGNFPGHDICTWRLLFERVDGVAKVTVATEQNSRIPNYENTIALGGAAAYTTAIGFVTATGYTHTIRQLARDGSLVMEIANVQYTNGQPTDAETETIAVGVSA